MTIVVKEESPGDSEKSPGAKAPSVEPEHALAALTASVSTAPTPGHDHKQGGGVGETAEAASEEGPNVHLEPEHDFKSREGEVLGPPLDAAAAMHALFGAAEPVALPFSTGPKLWKEVLRREGETKARRISRQALPRRDRLSRRAAEANTPIRKLVASIRARFGAPQRAKVETVWERVDWKELSKEAAAAPEEAFVAFVRHGKAAGLPAVSVSALADLTPEELKVLQQTATDQVDDKEDFAEDKMTVNRTVKAYLDAEQTLRMDAMLTQHAGQFNDETHWDDSAGRPLEFEMPIKLKVEGVSTAPHTTKTFPCRF